MMRRRIFKSGLFSFTIRNFNIHSLAIEVFRVNNNIAVTITGDISNLSCAKSNFVVPILCKWLKFHRVLWFVHLEYDTRLDKRFWNFRLSPRQNPKLEPN